ncbi:hypothetical protein FACS1894141_3480 [Spirochaetia bacterium]|nr:hypothetical protein FACS1894141_3480 [Spirochaetia bacterium]
MEYEFIFRNSAFEHKLTEADIRHAADLWSDETCRYMGLYDERENVYLLLGFDMKANPVEILYNEIGENGVNVFHAMPCRSQFLTLFEED